jgi:hypothetical protein
MAPVNLTPDSAHGFAEEFADEARGRGLECEVRPDCFDRYLPAPSALHCMSLLRVRAYCTRF